MSTNPALTIINTTIITARTHQYHATSKPNPTNPNVMFIVITQLRCGRGHAWVIAGRGRDAFHWGDRGNFAARNPRGSPFQMPTRLADGLGLESDLAGGLPRPA